MHTEGLEFTQIYTTYQPKIHRYLIRMVGEYEAEDLTQEVFVRVSQALETFRGEAAISTWIYKIATNLAVDRLRSSAFTIISQDCLENPFGGGDQAEIADRNAWTGEKPPPVDHQVYRREMKDCITDFVNTLPEKYRTVLVLKEYEDFSNQAIAEILSVSLHTVKIRLHRARERLKDQLSSHCGSEWIEGNEFVPELKRQDLRSVKQNQA